MVIDVSATLVATTILRLPAGVGRKTLVCSCDVKFACSGRMSRDDRAWEGTAARIASMDCLISRTPVEKTRMSPPVSADVSKQCATCCRVVCQHSASVNGHWKRPHRSADQAKVDLLGARGDLERLQSPHVRLGHTARDERAAHAIELRLRRLAGWLSARPIGILREQGRQVRLEVKVLNGVREAAQQWHEVD
jgi:hypothetical protein